MVLGRYFMTNRLVETIPKFTFRSLKRGMTLKCPTGDINGVTNAPIRAFLRAQVYKKNQKVMLKTLMKIGRIKKATEK